MSMHGLQMLRMIIQLGCWSSRASLAWMLLMQRSTVSSQFLCIYYLKRAWLYNCPARHIISAYFYSIVRELSPSTLCHYFDWFFLLSFSLPRQFSYLGRVVTLSWCFCSIYTLFSHFFRRSLFYLLIETYRAFLFFCSISWEGVRSRLVIFSWWERLAMPFLMSRMSLTRLFWLNLLSLYISGNYVLGLQGFLLIDSLIFQPYLTLFQQPSALDNWRTFSSSFCFSSSFSIRSAQQFFSYLGIWQLIVIERSFFLSSKLSLTYLQRFQCSSISLLMFSTFLGGSSFSGERLSGNVCNLFFSDSSSFLSLRISLLLSFSRLLRSSSLFFSLSIRSYISFLFLYLLTRCASSLSF